RRAYIERNDELGVDDTAFARQTTAGAGREQEAIGAGCPPARHAIGVAGEDGAPEIALVERRARRATGHAAVDRLQLARDRVYRQSLARASPPTAQLLDCREQAAPPPRARRRPSHRPPHPA